MAAKEILGLKLEYLVDSNQAVEFKLIREPDDLRNDHNIFRPDMSHQIFGDDEQIYGYENLCIKIYYSAGNLRIFLEIDYEDRLEDAMPANIGKTLAEKYEYNTFITNMSQFEKLLEKEKEFVPYGTLLHSFVLPFKDYSRTFEIYKATTETKDFLQYHARMQTFVIWFIDAASFIDTEDSNWKFYVMYEKYTSLDNNTQYALVGYLTVYEYYSYPDKIRPRVSQALVLPPFQSMGLCAKLITTMQLHYASMKEVFDITVEDPAVNFQRVRDFVDCSNCLHLDSYDSEKLRHGFTNEMAEEARNKFKINKKQARRVYEILRLHATNIHNEREYRDYRLDIKRRLNNPFQKQYKIMLKCSQQHLMISNEDRMKKLQELFEELVEEYNKVIDRMSASVN